MNILQQATYQSNEVHIQSREYLYRGFIQVEKVSLKHRLFHQVEYTPILQRMELKVMLKQMHLLHISVQLIT